MKTINKTQFKIIYEMYNKNDYHKTLTNANQIEQAAKMADTMPEIFNFSHQGFKQALLSISSFEDIFKLIKYNQKYESELKYENKILHISKRPTATI